MKTEMFIIKLAILKGEFFDCYSGGLKIFFCKFYYTWVDSFNYKNLQSRWNI